MRLRNLAKANPWWKYGPGFAEHDPDFRRTKFIIGRRLPEVRPGNVYILRGVRRSGKTVLLKLLVDRLLREGVRPTSILYVSCDRLAGRPELKRIVEEFLELNPAAKRLYLLLDEITYLPDWFLVVKELAESDEIDRVCVVATGSSPLAIKERAERLPGRRVEGNEHYVRPLSFREFVLRVPSSKFPLKKEEVDALKRALERISSRVEAVSPSAVASLVPFADVLHRMLRIYMITGGFPNAIVSYLTEGRVDDRVYEEVIRMVLGDISKAGRSENAALGVLRYVADNMARRTDFLAIAREIDRHPDTVMDIVEALESGFVLMTLYSWDPGRRAPNRRKQKKFLFTDPFLFSSVKKYVYGLEFEDILIEIDKHESQIAEMLVASAIASSEEVPLMREWWSFLGFYYDQTKEVDVVYFGREVRGFEVKMGERVRRRRYPFSVTYITRDELDAHSIPLYLFLAVLDKGARTL